MSYTPTVKKLPNAANSKLMLGLNPQTKLQRFAEGAAYVVAIVAIFVALALLTLAWNAR